MNGSREGEGRREDDPLVEAIFDAVPGGVVQIRADGAIVRANAEALRILGYRYDALTSLFVPQLETTTVREDGSPCPASESPVTRVLVTGDAQPPTTFGVRRPDGTTSWAVFRATPMHDADGAIAGAVVTFLDITDRKNAEDAIARSELEWRLLAENHPDIVLIVDLEARIQSVNRRTAMPCRFTGETVMTLIHPDHAQDWKRRFDETLLSGEPALLEARGLGDAWYELTVVPMREDRALVVARDNTEGRERMASLAEKERLASVGMLSASVAHEIMNPLTYVLANLDFAMSERCPPGARMTKALLDAREGAARMQQIVWDLRALGRPGSEDLFYVDVRAIIETALRLAGPEISQNATLIADITDVPGVLASESRLCQVFINLLLNAAQAMAERPIGEREIRICTRTDEPRGLVGVDFSDTGSGIDPEHVSRIYDPFFTTKRSGTGLGLSISRQNLERMGGLIEVASQLGKGTTFTVWLSTTRASTPPEGPRTSGAPGGR